MKDLEKNNATGLIRLATHHRSGPKEEANRSESLEKIMIAYFRSRKEDNLKRSVPPINLAITNPKPRILSNDAVRPSNPEPPYSGPSWTKDINQMHQYKEYSPLKDAHSGHQLNDTSSLSLEIQDDSFFHPSIRDKRYRTYRSQDFVGQYIYYGNENEDDDFGVPGEISF